VGGGRNTMVVAGETMVVVGETAAGQDGGGGLPCNQ
jgi:hypothetical protein